MAGYTNQTMLLDFDDLPDTVPTFEADVCIIGAGAAGMTLAREFLGTSHRILVLESGGLQPEEPTRQLYDSTLATTSQPHGGIHDGRTRILGGTTTLWGGQALPLTPLDFESRDWVPHSGWPFSHTELTNYWARAGEVLQIDDVDFSEDFHSSFGVARAGFDPALAEHIYSRWSPQPNFAVAYRERLAAAENVRVVLHANVTQIVPTADGRRIDSLELASLSGRHGSVRGDHYAVCCGGIETARLLLASNRVQTTGLGNRHDLVGRYFQDHLSVRFADFTAVDRRRVENGFHTFYRKRTKYYPLLTAGRAFQQQERTLNISASVLFGSSEESPVECAKSVLREVRAGRPHRVAPRQWLALAANAGSVARQAYRYLVQRRSYTAPDAPFFLGSTVEQEPNPSSRVMLDPKRRDALGMPRTVLDWRLTPLTGHTLRMFARRLRDEFKRVGLGEVRLYPWIEMEDESWTTVVRDTSHHIGTARMHTDPRQGVVDAHCRVHDLENLHLASSAVFPTGGHSNPTFTLLLLTMRLADRLKALLLHEA